MSKKPEASGNIQPQEKQPDRPLECGDCKKTIAVCYTEIVGASMTRTSMCADCPIFQHLLNGLPASGNLEGQIEGYTGGLACGNCGTTLGSVRVGSPFGCSVCYEVFEEIIIGELLARGKIPMRLIAAKRSQAIHIGRTRGANPEISASMRLLALNEALSETLKREDYEQAAWLRDQIKALSEPQKKGLEYPTNSSKEG